MIPKNVNTDSINPNPNKIYKIMLGHEDLPTSGYNKIMLGKTYSDKVLSKSIIYVNNDKNR